MIELPIAFWASPHLMTGHLLLVAGMTVYALVGLHFVERDLLHHFGTNSRQ